MSSYRLNIRGIVVEVETPEDVLRLIDMATVKGVPVTSHTDPLQDGQPKAEAGLPTKEKPAVTSDPNQSWTNLLSLLNDNQLRVLRVIQKHPQGLTLREIAERLQCSGSTAAGYLGGGVRKNIPKAGFADGDVLVIEHLGTHPVYKPGPFLLKKDLK